MRLIELLKQLTPAINEEYVDRVPNTYNLGSTEVFRNPSQTEFRKLLRKYRELRSFIDPASGDLYAWNTKGTLHEPAMEHFNIKSDIFLALLKDSPLLLYSDEVPRKRKAAITSIMLSNIHLQRLYGFSGFHDVETDKWIEAPPTAIAEMEVGKEIDFSYDITGHHHGQDDGIVYAFNPETKDIYGQINWTSYQNETYINWIDVKPELQRQGVAKMMVAFLKKKNEEPIDWGMTTPEGTKLRKAIGEEWLKTVRTADYRFDVYRNPSRVELGKLIRKSEIGALRAAIVPRTNDLLVWRVDVIHDVAFRELGLQSDMRLELDKRKVTWNHSGWNLSNRRKIEIGNQIATNPYLERLYGNNFSFFDDDGGQWFDASMYKKAIGEAAGSNLWVRDLSNYRPISSNGSHWGRGQAGFNISESGRIYLTDNSEKDLKMSASEKLRHKAELGQLYPSHRDLTVGRGPDITAYSGIFTFEGEDAPTLWLYPDAEKALSKHPKMARGLASLIGVYNIGWSTPVRSNSSREVLFRLGDLMRKRKATEAVETPRLLYHGTLKKHIPAIKQTGLQPSIGYFVKKAYGETPDLKSVVFASEIRDMGKVTNAIVANVLADAGGTPITMDEFYELGAVVVLKYGKQFKHISYHDEEEDDIEHPFQAEPGDFYSYNTIEPYAILVDKRLEKFLDRIDMYPPEMNDFVVADEEEREYWG